MPSVSQAQSRLMHAAAAGGVEGVPKSVGEDFVRADHGKRVSKLPKRVKKGMRHAAKRGLVSEKQMKKMNDH